MTGLMLVAPPPSPHADRTEEPLRGRQPARRRRDRVERLEAAAAHREAHLDGAVARAARLVARGEARVGERDLALVLARDPEPRARRGRVGADVLLAHEEERAPAAD